MSFKFSVPTADPSDTGGHVMRAKQAKAWLETLDTQPLVDSARGIYTALYGSNRVRLEDDERFKLLETYGEKLHPVLVALARDYNEVRLPLTETAREAANISRDLLIEYAYGYKIILLEKANKLLLFSAKRQLPTLLHRAMGALSDLLTLSYKTYTPTPAGVWHEIHQIYHYAQFHALQDVPVDVGHNAASSPISVIYKQALLLALADPYRLMPGEVDKVAGIIAHFSGGAIIMPYSAELNGAGLFLVQSDSDRAPKALSTSTNLVPAPIDKVISTANLAFTLSELIAQLDGGTPIKSLALPLVSTSAQASDLLRRLSRAWSLPPKRAFNRQPAAAMAEICAGIKALNHYLSAERDPAPDVETALIKSATTLTFQAVADGASAEVRVEYQTNHCEILNQSASGLALRKSPEVRPLVAVGEIIGVKLPDKDSWNVGAARWVQSNDAQEIELGIQLISPTGIALMIEPASGPMVRKQEALLLPGMEALRQLPTILAPRDTFKEGLEYKLERPDRIDRIKATRLVEQTTHFDLFQFIAA
jgi:cyclic-di-GMP-binding protein